MTRNATFNFRAFIADDVLCISMENFSGNIVQILINGEYISDDFIRATLYDTYSIEYSTDLSMFALRSTKNNLFNVQNGSVLNILIAMSMAGYDPNVVFHIVQYDITIANECAIDESATAVELNAW